MGLGKLFNHRIFSSKNRKSKLQSDAEKRVGIRRPVKHDVDEGYLS